MRKIILLTAFFIFTVFVLPVRADILALSSKSIKYYGVGVINMPKSFSVYESPRGDANIIRTVNYEKIKKSAIVNSIDMRKVSYVTYVPSENIALLTVEMNTGNGWYNVYLNQQTGETGWIYNDNEKDFYTYKSLFYHFGKKYGVRMFSDLNKDKKVLYSKQSEDSQVLDRLKYPKYIAFTVLMGNWMLVTVNDMSSYAKVGWFHWRNEDGTLNMFPNFKEQI